MKIPFKKDETGNRKLGKKLGRSEESSKEILKDLKKYLATARINKRIIIISVAILAMIVTFLLLSSPGNNSNIASGSSKVSKTVLGKTNDSYVTKEGPYGNTSSNITIAYIVGVHPRESGAHQAVIQGIRESDTSLNKQYYLYIINAPIYENNYPQERLNGQLLANEYVVPDIINNSYQLAVDVHSSNGSYSKERFVFAPSKGNKSVAIALELKNKLSWMSYYYPPNPSSTEYVTIPLTEQGIPSIVYETYKYDSNTTTLKHAQEFIAVIDKSQIFK
jgi:hypothetical protein